MRSHRWKFIRSGGVDQVVIRSGADIVNVEHLDQKLWVALACPTRGLDIDPRTLDLIDSDNDGRIRAPELIEATRWVREHFADPDDLVRGGDRMPLAAIRADTDSGASLAVEAKRILELIAKPSADSIDLADLADLDKLLARQRFNGDGIVPTTAADDESGARLIQRIIDTHGGVLDRNGEPGIDRTHASAFFAEVESLQAWQREGEAAPEVLPLGERTYAAMQAVDVLQDKADDFFVRCRLAAFDPLSASALNPAEEAYRALAAAELEEESPGIAQLPLATIRPGRTLPLTDGVNPAWREALGKLKRDAAEPILGRAGCTLPLTDGVNPAWREALGKLKRDAAEPILGRSVDELAESDWARIKDALAPCNAWIGRKPAVKAASLPRHEVMAIASTDKAAILALIEQDQAIADKNARVVDLEKLVRFQRDLVHLLNNFVSFAEFYSGQGAIFEAGTLYLDARSCDLTVHVADPAKHAALAGLAKAYLAYCECTRPGEKMHVVAAFTAGDVDFLLVGRNGIFYDRAGRDWDATITKIVENPISVGQAFLSPYKKFSRMIEEQVAKRAALSASGVQERLSGLATASVSGARAQTPGERPATRRIDVGTVAALGVALGSISTVLVGVFAKFVDLGWWIPVALGGIVLAISGPSMLIAWLKLRQRSLGPILDASGWAINGRMKINVPLGRSLSKTARLPRNAERRMSDPYAEHHKGAWLVALIATVLIALVLAWRLERLNPWLPEAFEYRTPVAPAPGVRPP